MDNIFTKNEIEIIKNNFNAFKHNFGMPRIERGDDGISFYVFMDDTDSWVQYCYNIDYLNGWLYGCVQTAHNKVVFDEEVYTQYMAGGAREQYAMDHGTREIKTVRGHKCYVYRYSEDDAY